MTVVTFAKTWRNWNSHPLVIQEQIGLGSRENGLAAPTTRAEPTQP